MTGIIYKATNITNGKIYIGQTRSSLDERKGRHISDAKSGDRNFFHEALRDHYEDFKWEVVDEFSGSEAVLIHKLNVAEEYHIIKENSTDPDIGYNSTYGGYSWRKFTEKAVQRANADRRLRIPILQYDLDGNFVKEYESLSSVCREFGWNRTSRLKQITHGQSHGFMWREKTEEDFPKKIEPYAKPKRYNAGEVAVYNDSGDLVGVYDSIRKAQDATGSCHAVRKKLVTHLEIRSSIQIQPYYLFRVTEEPPKKIYITFRKKEEHKPKECAQAVAAYDYKGNLVKVFRSILDARTEFGGCYSTMKRYFDMEEPIVLSPNRQSKYIWRKCDQDGAPEKIAVIDNRPKHVKVLIKEFKPDGTKVMVERVMTLKRARERNAKIISRAFIK